MRAPRTLMAVVALAALLATACSSGATTDTTEPPADDAAGDTSQETSAPAEEEAEPVTIRYFTFSAAPDHLDHLDEMIAAFNEQYPHITVEVETAPFDEYFPKLQTQLAGGDAPDAFETNYENFVSFAAKGALADIGALASADSDFDASVYYGRAYEAFSHEGVQYGLPESYSTVLLMYNKELFDAAGVDYPTNDWTWEDEKAAAEKLSAEGEGRWGFSAGVHFWEFYKAAAQNGCQFFTGDQVTVDAPECVEALEYMLSFPNNDLQPTDAEMGGVSDGDMFLQGQLAMVTTGIWMFSAFAEAPFEWDAVVEPGGTQKATHFFSNGVAVSADSDKKEAAWKWISFFTGSPEAAEVRVAASWELPTLTDQSLFDSYLSSDQPPANRQAVLDSLNHAIVPPVIERQSEMQDAVNALIEQAKAGELSAQEALSQSKAAIEALLN